MNELQLPICALFFSTLICIVFFSKERVNKQENKLYSVMLICGLIDSAIVCIERFLVISGDMNNVTPFISTILQITNKIDFASLIILTSCLFLYTLLISIKDVNYNKVLRIVMGIDLITYIIVSFLNITLISGNGIISVTGSAIIPTYILCGLYLFLSILVTASNVKNINKKHVPIISIIFIFIFLMFIFRKNPYIMTISITITFVNYLMYFTIENPDLKLIDELTKTKNLAEKYNNDKSIFLFNMTQQIRTPLNNIEQLSEKVFESDDIDEIKEYALEIRNAEKKVSYVINGVLDVTTMDAKKIKIVENKYNINSLLKEVSLRAEEESSKKNLEFRKKFDLALPESLYGDSIRMKQIINAIISNSIKYTEKGFVELNVNSVISFDVCRLIISIKDSGIGMKTDEINKLFENNNEEIDIDAIDDKYVTLDIAKKMVNLIGGTITVQSEKNKGSEFTIIIDQKIVNDNNKIMDIVNEYEKSNIKKKILFVSKNEEEINFYTKKLSNNFELCSVNNREKMLNKIRKNEQFDLIIIKDEMDKISLEDTLSKLNEIKSFDTPYFILVDSKDKKQDITFIDSSDVISKDITQAQLISSIRSKIK